MTKDQKGYTQDMDKAKKLLDDAGYKDVDDDGLGEDKDGKEIDNQLCINGRWRNSSTIS